MAPAEHRLHGEWHRGEGDLGAQAERRRLDVEVARRAGKGGGAARFREAVLMDEESGRAREGSRLAREKESPPKPRPVNWMR